MRKRTKPKAPAKPDPAAMMQIVGGKWISQAAALAIELRLADRLAAGPKSTRELAAACGSPEDTLYRLLRALASAGFFAEVGKRKFRLTPPAELFRVDVPEPASAYVELQGHESTWRPWGELRYSVRTGQPAFDHIFGMPAFEYFAKHPETAAVFDRAMTSVSSLESRAVAGAYDFSKIGHLVDVGGGRGLLLATLLAANRKLRGTVFEMPHVAPGARALLAESGVADRSAVVEGDFFASVPGGGDAYVLKHIIHDWDDELATKILGTCHRAMRRGSKVLLVEMVVPPGNGPHFAKLLDLEMLIMTARGRERTKDEYRELLAGAGFKLRRVVATPSPASVVAAVKV